MAVILFLWASKRGAALIASRWQGGNGAVSGDAITWPSGSSAGTRNTRNRGIVQASIDGANQGSVCNQYATTATQQVSCSLANKALTAGDHTIRFTVTSKSSSSTGYMVVIDQLALTATSGGGSTCTATTLKEAAACKGRLIGTALERLRTFRGRLPADFHFDREEASGR